MTKDQPVRVKKILERESRTTDEELTMADDQLPTPTIDPLRPKDLQPDRQEWLDRQEQKVRRRRRDAQMSGLLAGALSRRRRALNR